MDMDPNSEDMQKLREQAAKDFARPYPRNSDYLGHPADPTPMYDTAIDLGHTVDEVRTALEYIKDMGVDTMDETRKDLPPAAKWRMYDLAFKGLMFERGLL